MDSFAVSQPSGLLGTGPPQREPDALTSALQMIGDRLPRSWSIEGNARGEQDTDARVDAQLRLRAPDGGAAVLLVQAKRLLDTREVPAALEALQRAASRLENGDPVISMLVARYLAPATRERIKAGGAAYADATGNLLLTVDRPSLFISDRGADRDPWRGPGRPRGTLKGPAAARVVRALADFAPPFTVPELAGRAGASSGATYRVVEFAQGKGLLERQRRGAITDVRWRRLLERWSDDYGFARSNTVATFLEPRGLGELSARLRGVDDLKYVMTGSLAAQSVAAQAPARLATIYVDDIARAAGALELRPLESGANVALASGEYGVVFERRRQVDGLRMAALTQVAVDLLTGPGRNPSEGSALLDWMEADESRWRR